MKSILWICPAVVVAMLALSVSVNAAEPVTGKGGATLLSGNKGNIPVSALREGVEVSMTCPKCKNVASVVITPDAKMTTKTLAVDKHLCATCGNTIELVGHGKAKVEVIRHVCKSCGSESAFCCVTTKGGGPTKGMEKK